MSEPAGWPIGNPDGTHTEMERAPELIPADAGPYESMKPSSLLRRHASGSPTRFVARRPSTVSRGGDAMQGVVRTRQVLAHPMVIVESFGLRVLVRALLAGRDETFLDIVSRCAEEGAREHLDEVDLLRTVDQFVRFERRARDLYETLSRQLAPLPEAAKFFATLARQEEGHAIVLSRVRRQISRGRFWTESKDLHLASLKAVDALLARLEEEARQGVSLARALDIVEALEGSELDLVFDGLNSSVDMRSRARFERFFALNQRHAQYCEEQVRSLRARHGS